LFTYAFQASPGMAPGGPVTYDRCRGAAGQLFSVRRIIREKIMSADDKVGKQDSLPFPPTPSASIAGRTMQESVYKRRVEPRRLPADVPNILIVLIDDARSGLALHPGRRSAHPNHGPSRDGRDLAQSLSHYGHVLAHTSIHTHRAESSPRRRRPDCGTGERLGRVLRPHSQESALVADVLKDYGYSTAAWGKCTTRRPRERPPPVLSKTGRLALVSNIFTDS
jgi:hypothetical protein